MDNQNITGVFNINGSGKFSQINDQHGNHFWYLDGNLHREDGPAVEYADGSKFWFINDKPHREDNPAMEYANGYKAWYLNGNKIEDPNKCQHDCCKNK